MAFGTVFTREGNTRSVAIRAVAKANNLDINFVEADSKKPTIEHQKANKLGKIPAFVGEDGFALSETIAVSIYLTSQNEKTTLLGKTKQDYASILRWMSFFNSEFLESFAGWVRPLLGDWPYNKKSVEDSSKAALRALEVANEHLTHNTYLVGERITLADIFAAGAVSKAFKLVLDKKFRQANPALFRWFDTIANQPIFSDVTEKIEYLDTPKLTNTPPKKPEQPKAAPAAAAVAASKPAPAAQDDDEPAAAPKPKHPLELLPRSSFPLDEWKRKYSNEDTPVALKWFWENVPFNEYSIWRCDYKYNDELTLTFMSNNLIGGFNTRLEGSRKYLFGCASVYGENNDSVIQGAFVIRGEDYLPVFDVAPDYESYAFTKLDPTKPEDREYLEAQWLWEKPVVVNGKEYAHADGKVFK